MRKLMMLLLLGVLIPAAVPAGEAQKYTCPMHPHYIADAPGTCPICGMDLVPVETEPGTAGRDAAGRAAVTITPEIIQNMGVRTAPAGEAVFGRNIRAFGSVTENTRLQTVVASRVEGWIEELAVKAVGDTVKKGGLLFRLYSPDLVAAQQDYLAALRSGSAGRIASSARRLESLGVQEQTLNELRSSRRTSRQVAFYAAHDGIVAKLDMREGAYVKPGDTLAVIQDYSSVWIRASVAEKDLALIETGQPARLSFPALPGREITGTVDYIHPTVDPQSRTGQVRLVLENAQGVLRPGAYADIVFEVASQQRLAVPSEAILRDSRGAYVVRALGGGRFQPVRIETGLVTEGQTEVRAGLGKGEDVVVSGQFLIDSESALRESFRKMSGGVMPGATLAGLDLPAADLARIDHFIDAALYLHDALTHGWDIRPEYLDAALKAGTQLQSRYGSTALGPILERAGGAVRAAQKAESVEALRSALTDLVSALKPWLTEGRPGHYRQKGLRLASDHGGNRLWVQQGQDLVSPYGTGMVHEIPLTGQTAVGGAPPEAPKGMGGGHEHR